jgi:hypothetical protein
LHSCNRHNNVDPNSGTGSDRTLTIDTASPHSNAIKRNDISSGVTNCNGNWSLASLEGVWTVSNGENQGISFQILKDSIFYMDDVKGYKLTLRNNVLTFHLDHYDVNEKVLFVGEDSFVALSDDERMVYLRVK